MKHILYSNEAIDLIVSRMPDEFYRRFVRLYFGSYISLGEIAAKLNYSIRSIQRYAVKVRKMVADMPDIVNGDVVKREVQGE